MRPTRASVEPGLVLRTEMGKNNIFKILIALKWCTVINLHNVIIFPTLGSVYKSIIAHSDVECAVNICKSFEYVLNI